ncbi:MAG: exodeoxyribonuclease VII small subunit [Burkholderiales bacterium]
MGKNEKTDLPKSYEAAVAELEALVAAMEQGDLLLEQSLISYQRGATLLKYCQAQLVDAQERVRVLEAGELKPFMEN